MLSGWGDAESGGDDESVDDAEDVEAAVEMFLRELKAEKELIAVYKYLCRVGVVPESVLGEGYDALIAYFQGGCISM